LQKIVMPTSRRRRQRYSAPPAFFPSIFLQSLAEPLEDTSVSIASCHGLLSSGLGD
jgi:hypothetical protein